MYVRSNRVSPLRQRRCLDRACRELWNVSRSRWRLSTAARRRPWRSTGHDRTAGPRTTPADTSEDAVWTASCTDRAPKCHLTINVTIHLLSVLFIYLFILLWHNLFHVKLLVVITLLRGDIGSWVKGQSLWPIGPPIAIVIVRSFFCNPK